MAQKVKMGFNPTPVMVPVDRLLKTRNVQAQFKQTEKYLRLLASIREVGIIEPLSIYPQKGGVKTYLLLDGHLRAEALKDLGWTEAPCLVALDDEGYTYNRQVNHLSALQEHFMLMKALEEGVSEERLARALSVDIKKLREKKDLLTGICPEAVGLMRTRDFSANTVKFFKRVRPLRQIEMAELMIASNNYSVPYARALFLATPQELLLASDKQKEAAGVSPEDLARIEREMTAIERDFRMVKDTYGTNVLKLQVARSFLVGLLDNARVVRFLSSRFPEILAEFQRITTATSMEG